MRLGFLLAVVSGGIRQGRLSDVHSNRARAPWPSLASTASPFPFAGGGAGRLDSAGGDVGRSNPVSTMADLLQELGGAGGSDEQRCCAWMGLAGLVDGLYRHYRRAHYIFLFFYFINRDGHQNHLGKRSH